MIDTVNLNDVGVKSIAFPCKHDNHDLLTLASFELYVSYRETRNEPDNKISDCRKFRMPEEVFY